MPVAFETPTCIDIDPLRARGCEDEAIAQLALEDVGHVHRVFGRVAEDRGLEDVHLGRGHVINADSGEQVLVDLALEAVLVIEQEALGAVEKGDVEAIEVVDRLLQAPEPDVREDLAIDEFAGHHDLGTVRCHEIHLVHDGGKELM